MAHENELHDQVWNELSDSRFVMMALEGKDDGHSQPMTLFMEDKSGPAYIFTNRDNRLVSEIDGRPRAVAHFISKGQNFFACIHGQLSLHNDPAVIDKFWSPMVATWYPGGRNDPNLVLVRFDPDQAELWNSDMSLLGKVKMMVGAKLKPDEVGTHAETVL